jgi:hypothetical protein
VKRVPCHVLETRKSHVMDGRVVSRGLCLTLGNPGPQPSCLAMVVAASLVHAAWRPKACPVTSPPISVTSWSFYLLWAVTIYLGMIMPFLDIFASICYRHPLRYYFDHPSAKPCKC